MVNNSYSNSSAKLDNLILEPQWELCVQLPALKRSVIIKFRDILLYWTSYWNGPLGMSNTTSAAACALMMQAKRKVDAVDAGLAGACNWGIFALLSLLNRQEQLFCCRPLTISPHQHTHHFWYCVLHEDCWAQIMHACIVLRHRLVIIYTLLSDSRVHNRPVFISFKKYLTKLFPTRTISQWSVRFNVKTIIFW